jgi:hypothetical protein
VVVQESTEYTDRVQRFFFHTFSPADEYIDNFMEESFSGAANCVQTLCNPNIHYRFLSAMLSHLNPLYTIILNFIINDNAMSVVNSKLILFLHSPTNALSIKIGKV